MFQQVSLTAIGISPWVPLDYRQRPFNVGIQVQVASTVTAVGFTVEVSTSRWSKTPAGLGGGDNVIPTSITRVTTVATVVTPFNHGLNVNDTIIVFDSDPTSSPNADSGATTLDGTFLVASVVSATSFTYTVVDSGTGAAGNFVSYIPIFHQAASTALTGATASLFAALADQPATAVRLNVTAYTGTGPVTMNVIQGPSSS